MAIEKMHFCFNCGVELGVYAGQHPLDTCGARECEREARDQADSDRNEAHDRLDRDNFWDLRRTREGK